MIPEETSLPFDHNTRPFDDIRGRVVRDQREALERFADRKEQFLRSAGAAVVRDRETAGMVADVVKLASEVWKRIDSDRLERTNPLRDAADAALGEARDFWTPVNDEMIRIQKLVDDWDAEEEQRVENQRVEQEREMAKAREASNPLAGKSRAAIVYDERDAYPAADPSPEYTPAPSPPPRKRTPIRGDLGGKVSKVDVTEYEIEDFTKIPLSVLQSPTVTAAILAFVKGTAKHMGVPAGIRKITGTKNRIG